MRGRRVAWLALALIASSSAARDHPEQAGRPHSHGFANPGALIAAELAMGRVAKEKGQWLAFREAAAPGAMLGMPQPEPAEPLLKGRTEPPVAMEWQIHAVWSSCDGSYGVTRGVYRGQQGNGGPVTGSFVTVWQRQEKNIGYQWLLRLERPLAAAPPEPEMIGALVADCPKPGTDEPPAPPPSGSEPAETAPPINPLDAASDDDTLSWSVGPGPDGTPQFVLKMKRQGEVRLMLDAY